MAVRDFSGSSDLLTLSIGAASGLPASAFTMVLLANRQSTAHDPVFGVETSTTTLNLGMLFADTGTLYFANNTNNYGAGNLSTTNTNWLLYVITHPSGTGVTRGHAKNITTGAAWSHANGDSSAATSGTADRIKIGGYDRGPTPGRADVRVAVAALYSYAMTDAQVESLATNLRTSDLFNVSSSGADPVAAWELNQAATTTSVTDLTGGGADQSALTGTTVVTTDDPPGWTFDGVGATTQTVRPDGDLATTGWAVAPLYSKVNDSSDATVITATLA